MNELGDFSGLIRHGLVVDIKPTGIVPISIPLKSWRQALGALQYEDEYQAEAILEKYIGKIQGEPYPMYAFFLYSDKDKDIAEFVRSDGHWLNSLSGFNCLIGVCENPGEWGEGWELYWKDILGPRFKKLKKEWMNLKPYDRNTAFLLADLLGVDKSTLPCMVFLESLPGRKILCLPIIDDKAKYQKYFQDVFAAVSSAAKARTGERLETLRLEWKKLWPEWALSPWIKKLLKSIQEWGTQIAQTKSVILDVVDPTPVWLKKAVKKSLV